MPYEGGCSLARESGRYQPALPLVIRYYAPPWQLVLSYCRGIVGMAEVVKTV
jgi:hypothetical protein